VSSPARHRLLEHGLRCCIIRVRPVLDKFFHTLQPHAHWNHLTYVRLLIVVIAYALPTHGAVATWPASTGIWMPSITARASTTFCLVVR
jgi:hypothetical protein